jgi:hypothetical protein
MLQPTMPKRLQLTRHKRAALLVAWASRSSAAFGGRRECEPEGETYNEITPTRRHVLDPDRGRGPV